MEEEGKEATFLVLSYGTSYDTCYQAASKLCAWLYLALKLKRLFCCDTGIHYTERLRALTHARKNFTINSSSEEIENKQTFEQLDLTYFNAVMVGKTLISALSA